MAIDYESHPSRLTKSGVINHSIMVQNLRNAIPAHCWKPCHKWAIYYALRDLTLVIGTMWLGYIYIPRIENTPVRGLVWIAYGYIQGLFMTGIWILGHESGHSAFSPWEWGNHIAGFIFHSIVLTPYFSWRSTHRRHHIYANNLEKDHNYVPPNQNEYFKMFKRKIQRVEDLSEDAPYYTFGRILLQQICGWPWYLLFNITATPSAIQGNEKDKNKVLDRSHYLPTSSLFRTEEAKWILLSDIGLIMVLYGVLYCIQIIGWSLVFLLYVQPYMWVNHWVVAITYLHHTHPDVPKYSDEAWSFIKGATATIDRNFGWIGRVLLHNVIEYHVVHHLFSRIPFYHGEEATNAIKPLLGPYYHEERNLSIWSGLWEAFTQCQYVVPENENIRAQEQIFWYKSGPSPPPVVGMRKV